MFGGYMRYGLWRELRRKGRLANWVPGPLWPLLQRYREIQRYAGVQFDPTVAEAFARVVARMQPAAGRAA